MKQGLTAKEVEELVYPFNERGNPKTAKETKTFEILKKINDGKATQSEKDEVFRELNSSSLFGHGKKVAYLGNFIDFSPFLNRYAVKYNYGDFKEVYAFNKQNIRNSYYTNRGIKEIHELTSKLHSKNKKEATA